MGILSSYVTVADAAKVLGVHPETVKRLCRAGRIPAEKVHNTWLIAKKDLSRFAASYDEPRRGKRKTEGIQQ